MIELNKEFLENALPIIKKNINDGTRHWLEGVIVADTGDNKREYFATDGHKMLYMSEKRENKEFETPVLITFERLPTKIKNLRSVMFEKQTENTGLLSDGINKEFVRIEACERLDDLKKILPDFDSGVKCSRFILFNPDVLDACKAYMGNDFFRLPFTSDVDGQETSPVFWLGVDNTENVKCCVAMPVRCAR